MATSVIGALRVSLGLDATQFSRGLRQAESSMQRLGRQMQIVGAAVSAVGTGVALAIRGQLQEMETLGEVAQQIGVPVEALSQLEYAAEQSGGSLEGLRNGLSRLGVNMVQNGASFEQFGISVRDAEGNIRPVIDVMMDVADRMAEMPDGAEKTAMAMSLMGRGSAEMIPILTDGSDALRQMMAEADSLGLTVSQESSVAAGMFNDNMDRIKETARGFTRQIAENLAPELGQLSEWLVDLSTSFGELDPKIQDAIATFAGISVALGPALLAIGGLVLLFGAPVFGLIALITFVVAGIITFREEIREFVKDLPTFSEAWEIIKSDFQNLKTYIVDLIENGIQLLRDQIANLGEKMYEMAFAMEDAAKNGVEWVKAKFQELIDWFVTLPAQFIEYGRNIIIGLANGLKAAWEEYNPVTWLKGKAQEMLNVLPEWARMQSPSRVMREQGENLIAGLDIGIRSTLQGPIDAMHELAAAMGQVIDEGDIDRGIKRITDLFTSIWTGAQSAKDALSELLMQMAEVQIQKGLLGLFDAVPILGTAAGMLGDALEIPSFDGGGRTGSGPRSGGLDGLGGMLAMLHPNETIIPDSMMGSMGGQVEVVVRVDNGNIRAEIEHVSAGMAARAVSQYDNRLPSRVRQIRADPRAI